MLAGVAQSGRDPVDRQLNRALDSLDIVAARIQTAFGALSIEKFDLQIRKHVEIGCAQIDRLSKCGIPGEQTLGPRYIATFDLRSVIVGSVRVGRDSVGVRGCLSTS